MVTGVTKCSYPAPRLRSLTNAIGQLNPISIKVLDEGLIQYYSILLKE